MWILLLSPVKKLTTPGSWRYSLVFPSGSFMVLPVTFMFVIHLRLTVFGVWKRLRFSFFCKGVQLCSNTIIQNTCLFPRSGSDIFVVNQVIVCVLVSFWTIYFVSLFVYPCASNVLSLLL